MTVDIKQLRIQLERMDDEGMPSLPWETDDEMGVLALGGRHCIGELSPQIVADFVVYVVNALPTLLDDVERLREALRHIAYQKPVSSVRLDWHNEWGALREEAKQALGEDE